MMNEEQILYCLIAFILGYLVSRYMGNGFSIGGTKCSGMGMFWSKCHSAEFQMRNTNFISDFNNKSQSEIKTILDTECKKYYDDGLRKNYQCTGNPGYWTEGKLKKNKKAKMCTKDVVPCDD